jgi:NAD(P)-dependent dehydrogenase (short-subunit alcohol dehydrogenase family)
MDATQPQHVDAVVERAITLHGRLDGGVNCVGSLLLKPAHLTSDAEWRETLAKSLDSAFYLLRATVKHLMKEGGSLVFVSTAAARIGLSNHEAIAAAKAGIIGLTLAAAASYSNRGIRVNCVAPGLVETQMTDRITSNEKARATSTSMHALGRLGNPDDVARAIVWLLDSDQSWVTGQTLGVDGGLATVRPSR